MAYPDELLRHAREVLAACADGSNQAGLRRAVSTAYYALFHLLISDAASTCGDDALRVALARIFDHGAMRQASDRVVSESNRNGRRQAQVKGEQPVSPPDHLFIVADAFVIAQRNRLNADYNLNQAWQAEDAEAMLRDIERAFRSWAIVREDPLARAYLASMLPGKERKQTDRGRAS